jgi:hypothetical protein
VTAGSAAHIESRLDINGISARHIDASRDAAPHAPEQRAMAGGGRAAWPRRMASVPQTPAATREQNETS